MPIRKNINIYFVILNKLDREYNYYFMVVSNIPNILGNFRVSLK
jgi:hypothetical protein